MFVLGLLFLLMLSFLLWLLMAFEISDFFDSPLEDIVSKISDLLDKKRAIKMYYRKDLYCGLKRFNKLKKKVTRNKNYRQPLAKELAIRGLLRNMLKAPLCSKKIVSSDGFSVERYKNCVSLIKKLYICAFKDIKDKPIFEDYAAFVYLDCIDFFVKYVPCNNKKERFIEEAYRQLELLVNKGILIANKDVYQSYLKVIHLAEEQLHTNIQKNDDYQTLVNSSVC